MSNVKFIKTHVEPFVRENIREKYHVDLKEGEVGVGLITGGKHRFDIVSQDGQFIAGIKSSIARADKQGESVGKYKSAYTELYFLSLVNAKKKLLIFTDQDFFNKFKKKSVGHIPKDIELVYCSLKPELEKEVRVILKNSRDEMVRPKMR